MSWLFHRDNARRIIFWQVLKQVPLGSSCSFVCNDSAREIGHWADVIIRQRIHSKDYWVTALLPVVFFQYGKYFMVASGNLLLWYIANHVI